jgi:ketosteroid isomerase-like protein
MTEPERLLQLTHDLLGAISAGDWNAYVELCAEDLTCFEPEARGVCVEGLPFHKFYFDRGAQASRFQATIADPKVRMLGPDAAVVAYTRLIQFASNSEPPMTERFEETRVWHRIDGTWKHVHFHRSVPA